MLPHFIVGRIVFVKFTRFTLSVFRHLHIGSVVAPAHVLFSIRTQCVVLASKHTQCADDIPVRSGVCIVAQLFHYTFEYFVSYWSRKQHIGVLDCAASVRTRSRPLLRLFTHIQIHSTQSDLLKLFCTFWPVQCVDCIVCTRVRLCECLSPLALARHQKVLMKWGRTRYKHSQSQME